MQSKRPQQRVSSAYFSDEYSSHIQDSSPTKFDSTLVSPPADVKKQLVIPMIPNDAATHRATHFPNQRSVLWNRSNYGGAIVLTPSTVLPALKIPPQSVTVLMQQLLSRQEGHSSVPDGSMFMLLGHLESIGALSDTEVRSLKHCCPSANPEHFIISLSSNMQQQQQQQQHCEFYLVLSSVYTCTLNSF